MLDTTINYYNTAECFGNCDCDDECNCDEQKEYINFVDLQMSMTTDQDDIIVANILKKKRSYDIIFVSSHH